MSVKAEITLEWGDDTYLFRLPIARLQELQEKCDAGPGIIYAALATGEWRVEDIRETIRLGLIGGGLDPLKARKLVERYVDDCPLLPNAKIAERILRVSLEGAIEEPIEGKQKAEAREPDVEKSPSQSSTAPAPSSELLH